MENDNNTQKKKWSKKEDKQLLSYYEHYKTHTHKWDLIADQISNRNPSQCAQRYRRIITPVKKGKWTKEEDRIIIQCVENNEKYSWQKIANMLEGRCGKQIKERYQQILNPNIIKDKFSDKEDWELLNLYYRYGTSWKKISKSMPQRSENMLKNRFNSYIKKHLLPNVKQMPILNEDEDKIEEPNLEKTTSQDISEQQGLNEHRTISTGNQEIITQTTIETKIESENTFNQSDQNNQNLSQEQSPKQNGMLLENDINELKFSKPEYFKKSFNPLQSSQISYMKIEDERLPDNNISFLHHFQPFILKDSSSSFNSLKQSSNLNNGQLDQFGSQNQLRDSKNLYEDFNVEQLINTFSKSNDISTTNSDEVDEDNDGKGFIQTKINQIVLCFTKEQRQNNALLKSLENLIITSKF